ncbi:MAG: hypothetical protein IPH44_03840 [Myxococcales bacterium]|nr:hypothetical protein [Myxococcales bacterium]MBK7197176.1 hypothetical protein [Myxococcales bacterium]MBP6845968.1 hypothetical protein [Kofleriaceae bacterium]
MRATLIAVRWAVAATGAAARGRWPTRAATIVALVDGDARGCGEAAPLPGFGDDPLPRATAELAAWQRDPRAPIASPSAAWAIATASASLAAARAGLPLARAWGAPPGAALATAAVVDDPAAALAALAAGARALKLKLDGVDDRARVAAIRAVAPAAILTADANQAWPRAEVDDRLAALAGFGLAYVEEPAAGLAGALPPAPAVPIALDESLAAPDRDRWLPAALATGAIGALILKPTVLGPAACRTLAAQARAHGVPALVSHALEGPIGFAAARALALAVAPTAIHGLGPHPALAAWGEIAAVADGLGLAPAELDRAIARLAVSP